MKKKSSYVFIIAAVSCFAVSLISCKAKKQVFDMEKTSITYGKSPGPYTVLFEDAIKPILEEQGYTVKGIDFQSLLLADVALNANDVDLNVDQHTAYMEDFNKAYKGNLVAISPIPTVPAGVFSARHKSIEEIKAGAIVAVPNDASNTARAYLLLQKIGWIKLRSDANPSTVTQDDIVENPLDLQLIEQNSSTIPPALQDFDYAVITGSIVYNAKIDPATALAQEDVMPQLVLQVVVKAENKEAKWAKAIAAAYHSDDFKRYIKKNNTILWWVPSELQCD